MRGKLIAIEGLDGAGKATQSKLLVEHLNKEHGETKLYSFPRYETSTGVEVGRYLRGELGELNILQRAKLYSDDRLAAKLEMLDDLYSGRNVVCDRYVLSNACYFTAFARLEALDGKRKLSYPERVWKHILKEEFEVNGLPTPDATIYLTLPLEVTQANVLKKAARSYTKDSQDLHERNSKLLDRVHKEYDYYLGRYDNPFGYVYILNCFDEETNSIRSVESIAQAVQINAESVLRMSTAE